MLKAMPERNFCSQGIILSKVADVKKLNSFSKNPEKQMVPCGSNAKEILFLRTSGFYPHNRKLEPPFETP